ncbi:MAG: sugar phosphate isomerase/epimerase [Opitutaceae bacterium]|nr:sugar phosphate isomerase/epimerase [Opitutaceae bacterium]MBP9911990.1 sugar phosphate isomerase/epimerase [Opitutaceae bacterium]
MKASSSSLGIQSYCFRGSKDLGTVLTRLTACGVSTIELCGVHVDFSNEAGFDAVIAQCRAAGVSIVSLGVERFAANLAKERLLGEFARKSGAKVITADFDPGAGPEIWRAAEKLADEYDLYLAIHNHGGRHWLGNTQTLAHVFAKTSARIGLCLDTAWALDSHEDPVAMTEKFADRLYGVHLKDFIFDRAGKPADTILGEGNLDLPKMLTLLKANPRTTSVIIEYEGDIENPVPALTQCVQKIRATGY